MSGKKNTKKKAALEAAQKQTALQEAMAQPQRQKPLLPKQLPPRTDGAPHEVLFLGHFSAHPSRPHPYFKQEGWKVVRMDSDPSLNADIKGTLTELGNLPSGSVDAIWAQHILQQFYVHQIGASLREMYRIVREGGFVFLSVPDAQVAAAFLANNKYEEALYHSPTGGISATDILYGYHKFIAGGAMHQSHKFGFTPESLGLAMRSVGFTNIQVQAQFAEIIVTAYKYPYDHPERAERVAISRGIQHGDVPTVAPVKSVNQDASAVQAPKAPERTGALTDELDAPPRLWKPLNLKK